MLAEKMSAEQAREWGLVYLVIGRMRAVQNRGAARQLATTVPHEDWDCSNGEGQQGIGDSLSEQLDYEEELQRRSRAHRGLRGRYCTHFWRSGHQV